MKFLKTFCLLLILIACRPEPVIDYATAFKNCPIDTITAFGPNDTMFYYQPDIDGLIGAQLPDFFATSIDGKTIDKNYFADKVSVINFWFEGCHPCEEEMPGFNKLNAKSRDSTTASTTLPRHRCAASTRATRSSPTTSIEGGAEAGGPHALRPSAV